MYAARDAFTVGAPPGRPDWLEGKKEAKGENFKGLGLVGSASVKRRVGARGGKNGEGDLENSLQGQA